MKITKIEEQKKHKNRMSVFLDGAFAFGIDAYSLYALKLSENDEIDEATLAHIKDTVLFEDAKNYAARLLSTRSYTERDMQKKLLFRTGSETVTEKTVVFLKEYKLIDDADFARRYAADCLNIKKYGRQKIKYKLIEKGIAKELAEEIVSADMFFETESENLAVLMEKRLRGDFEKTNVMKAKRYFAARGYSFDEIDSVVRKLKAQSEEWS